MRIAIDIRWIGRGMCARKVVCTLAATMLLASFSFSGQERRSSSKTRPAGSFDAPIKEVTVDIRPSLRNHDTHGTLSCYYYPHLLVKEYAQGGPGAELSMLRTRGKLPACKLSQERGERAIDWSGYFKGVKDNLVFFDGDDSFDGALSFSVYDSITGKKLFADWAYDESTSARLFSRVRVFSTKAGYLLKYVSVAEVDCDLHLDGRTCWEKVKAKLDLKTDRMPVCTGYDHIAELFGTDHVESRVAYPVEVTLSPHPTIKTVAGPVKCWPTQ